MGRSSGVNRTGIAVSLSVLGLALIGVGVFRAFGGDGTGLEILSAVGLFGFAALFARGFLTPPLVSALALACMVLPVIN